MPTWKYLLLILAVLLGGGLAFVLRRQHKKALQLVLSFSGAYILGITVIHLMPEIFRQTSIQVGPWILLGFFVQLLLEQLSQGIEHGHVHVHEHASPNFAWQIMIGLCLHAFLEGMPLGNHDVLEHVHHDHDGIHHLYYGILLHKMPAAFALGLILLFSGFRTWTAWLCISIFALMSPLGAVLFELIHFSLPVTTALMAFVVGSFLHIATTILFEIDTTQKHRIPMGKFVAVALGSGLSLLTLLS